MTGFSAMDISSHQSKRTLDMPERQPLDSATALDASKIGKEAGRLNDQAAGLFDQGSGLALFTLPRRQSDGGTPTIFLKARLNAASDP
jgi:hypothetical protein